MDLLWFECIPAEIELGQSTDSYATIFNSGGTNLIAVLSITIDGVQVSSPTQLVHAHTLNSYRFPITPNKAGVLNVCCEIISERPG